MTEPEGRQGIRQSHIVSLGPGLALFGAKTSRSPQFQQVRDPVVTFHKETSIHSFSGSQIGFQLFITLIVVIDIVMNLLVPLKAIQIITKRGLDIIGSQLFGTSKDSYVLKEIEIVRKG